MHKHMHMHTHNDAFFWRLIVVCCTLLLCNSVSDPHHLIRPHGGCIPVWNWILIKFLCLWRCVLTCVCVCVCILCVPTHHCNSHFQSWLQSAEVCRCHSDGDLSVLVRMHRFPFLYIPFLSFTLLLSLPYFFTVSFSFLSFVLISRLSFQFLWFFTAFPFHVLLSFHFLISLPFLLSFYSLFLCPFLFFPTSSYLAPSLSFNIHFFLLSPL